MREVIRALLPTIVVCTAWAAPAAATSAPAADDEYIEYIGTASARHAQHVLYGEHHVLAYRAGRLRERLVLYTCPNGAAFARKRVSYIDMQAPDFFFDDASNGMQEGVRDQDGERLVFFRANRIEPERSAPLPRIADLVADAGFDEFIHAQWSKLMYGAALPLRFLVPSRLQAMSFEVQHLRSDHVDGNPAEVFRLKLAGMLGMVVPGIEVAYDATQHVLLRFEGISDLRDAAGDNLQATIVFRPGDRRPASAQVFAAVEQANIKPCH
jgi:hypothetical protein